MRCLIKYLLLLLLLFVLTSNTPNKETENSRYALRISSTWEEDQHGIIQLNDGTKWVSNQNDLWRRAWLAGDKIRILRKIHDDWLLENITYGNIAVFNLNDVKDINLPFIISISNSGGTIYLSDGSTWKIPPWNRLWGRTWRWQEGDHMLISPQTEANSFLLINTDREMLNTSAILQTAV